MGQVTDNHPLANNKTAVKVYQNIFSFGDICITPANEPKQIVSMHQYGHVIANNILQIA